MDMSTIVTLVLAVVPAIILCCYIYTSDVVEKEPMWLLLTLFVFGIISTVPAVFLERLYQSFFGTEGDLLWTFMYAFLGIALIEEGYKALFTYLIVYKNKNFDHIFDGIVYAVFMSLGFATLENVLYLFRYGLNLAFSRALISVPAHAFYAVSFGFFLGEAKKAAVHGEKGKSRLFLALSMIVPILLHGTFDFLLLSDNVILYKVFLFFVVFLYIISFIQVKIHANVMTMLDN
jgi:RsiW-degrading membrane proteinase PrsW (M82 family)